MIPLALKHQPQMSADTERGQRARIWVCRQAPVVDDKTQDWPTVMPSHGRAGFTDLPCQTGGRFAVRPFHSHCAAGRVPACAHRRLIVPLPVAVSRLQIRCGGWARITQPAFTRISLDTKLLECLCQDSVEPPESHRPNSSVRVADVSNPRERLFQNAGNIRQEGPH